MMFQTLKISYELFADNNLCSVYWTKLPYSSVSRRCYMVIPFLTFTGTNTPVAQFPGRKLVYGFAFSSKLDHLEHPSKIAEFLPSDNKMNEIFSVYFQIFVQNGKTVLYGQPSWSLSMHV